MKSSCGQALQNTKASLTARVFGIWRFIIFCFLVIARAGQILHMLNLFIHSYERCLKINGFRWGGVGVGFEGAVATGSHYGDGHLM